ncbi:RloB family protein [Frankia sp. AgKG'84/4]|uniref:RloB family protein n=1 Tax=Frankia sp. AgKG'84/4 TaxID=573490 RepID=UPI00200E945D|nr:RloB family protein [Frankia sp. AgKG'84/4]MCL9795563.1 RloB family protein [Frankia sp. AgKG'84/4]
MIFCEGKRSEPDYLNGIKQLPHVARNTAISIEIDLEHGVPLSLVKRAVQRKGEDKEIDEFWCVFDVEWPNQHPNLEQAVSLAQQHDVRLAISNPCFELWLILHFEQYTRFASTDKIERHSKNLDGRTGKRINAAQYMPLRGMATTRAQELSARHKQDGNQLPKNNPSSSVTDLLIRIESIATSSPATRNSSRN